MCLDQICLSLNSEKDESKHVKRLKRTLYITTKHLTKTHYKNKIKKVKKNAIYYDKTLVS